MFEGSYPIDELVQSDPAGYLEAQDAPDCEEERFDLDGKAVE